MTLSVFASNRRRSAGSWLAVGLSSLWTQRVRYDKQRLFFVAWALTPRTLKVVAGGLVGYVALTAVVTVTVLAVLAAHLG